MFKIIAIAIAAFVYIPSEIIHESKAEITPAIYKEIEVGISEEQNISFNSNDVREISNANSNDLENILKDTELKGLGESITIASNQHNINSIFLTALIVHESGWGKSKRKEQNNLTGYAVYSSNSTGRTFSSKFENINKTAQLISEEYLSEEGHSFNGYSVRDINKRYCLEDDMKTTDYNWSKSIISIGNDIRDRLVKK